MIRKRPLPSETPPFNPYERFRQNLRRTEATAPRAEKIEAPQSQRGADVPKGSGGRA